MNRYNYDRPRNPMLHIEVARAFARLQTPDFEHIQSWALVQAFAALFKTRRLPAYWLRHMQLLINIEHSRQGIKGERAIFVQNVPDNYQNRAMLMLSRGEEKLFVLFSSPNLVGLVQQPIFAPAACPIWLYLEDGSVAGLYP